MTNPVYDHNTVIARGIDRVNGEDAELILDSLGVDYIKSS